MPFGSGGGYYGPPGSMAPHRSASEPLVAADAAKKGDTGATQNVSNGVPNGELPSTSASGLNSLSNGMPSNLPNGTGGVSSFYGPYGPSATQDLNGGGGYGYGDHFFFSPQLGFFNQILH